MRDGTFVQVAYFALGSETEGPGIRDVVFLQGCSIGRTNACKGCQNAHIFPERGGKRMYVTEVVDRLAASGNPVSILGGEPFDQVEALAALVSGLKDLGRDVIIYTGHLFEELLQAAETDNAVAIVLLLADTLVDGRYVAPLGDDPFLMHVGSSNQRDIDLAATRATNYAEVILHGWNDPGAELELTFDLEAGTITGPQGLIQLLAQDNDVVTNARRCGQTKGYLHNEQV